MKKTILIIEDEQAIREMVRYALEHADFTVLEAEDHDEAMRRLADRVPDLILLDWMLPGLSGIDIARKLRKNKLAQDIPIILLTARAEEENRVKGLESGADDYVVKPFSPRELIARIRAVLRRGPLQTVDGIVTVGDLSMDIAKHTVTIAGKLIKLGPVEYRLLNFFVTHQNRVYSREQILNHVWGGSVYIDERTIDVHIRRLRKALIHVADRIQTVRSAGYRFSGE
jgi:two-component system, OmpR family, phosphate regulon response regulator PhoB